MSFILDALKKSENERQRTIGPSLADAPIRRTQTDRPWWAVAVAALLVVNLGVLIVVLMRNSATAKSGEVQAPVAVAPQPAAAAPPPPAPARAAESTMQPAMIPAEPVRPAPSEMRPETRQATSPAVRSLAEEASATQGGALADPRMSASVAAAAAVPEGPPMVRSIQPPAVTPLPSEPTFKSVTAPGSASRAAARNDEVLPSATDLAASGTSIPDLKLDIHVYSANPAERFVFVNMRKYLEGQTLQEGPAIEKITTDGVVLNQHGLRFVLSRQ